MRRIKILLTSTIAVMMLASCATTTRVPITGRKQRLSVPDEQILSLSASQYKEYLSSAKKSTNATNTAIVQRVGQKLANAVVSYLSQNGYADEVKNYAWEFNVVQSNSVNAFCMPGGKIVVYEGMLSVTQDEPSLAIVLGHEIAHAVAKHSAEQMSKQKNQSILTSYHGTHLRSHGRLQSQHGNHLLAAYEPSFKRKYLDKPSAILSEQPPQRFQACGRHSEVAPRGNEVLYGKVRSIHKSHFTKKARRMTSLLCKISLEFSSSLIYSRPSCRQ